MFEYQCGVIISQETISSASSLTQTLSGQLADGQRKLLEMAANSKVAADPFVTQINNGLHEMVCLFVIFLILFSNGFLVISYCEMTCVLTDRGSYQRTIKVNK
jgi:enhancer of mRNA-decapping protein 4